MINLYFIVVLYNKEAFEAKAVKNLLSDRTDNCHIVVTDNSDEDYCESNRKYCEETDIIYINMNGNKGISKATNRALDYIANQNPKENDLVVTLDDDTDITEKYLKRLQLEAEKYKSVDIFAPYMQGQNGVLYSPAKEGFFKNHHPKKMGDKIKQKEFFAIYSCCACRWRIFENYRYDDNLFVDLVDNNFCDDQRSLGRRFKAVKIIIRQNYALKNEGLTSDIVKKRMNIWIPDFYTYCKKKKTRIIGYMPAVAARGVMFAIKTHSIGLWFWMFGKGIECVVQKRE